jgi:DNA-binding beta-propeller fold protein YncE
MRLSVILLAISTACAGARDAGALKLLQTIPLPGVKGRFDHFAIDPKGQRLFVAALGNNSLEIIDLAAGKRLRSVAGMSRPTGVLYLPEPNQVVVANGGDGTLKFLDGAEYRVLQDLPDVADADNLRLDPKTRFAYLGYGEGALGVVDPATHTLIGSVKLPAHPESFQLEKQGGRIFVNVPDAKQIAVIDRTRRAVTETWPMETFRANFPMVLDEPSRRLFIGCRRPARLVVLDATTGTSVAVLPISSDIDDLFFDAMRKQLYLACGEGFVDTIQQTTPDTYKRISTLPTATGARTAFWSPDLDRFYLAVPDRGTQNAEIRVFQPN